MNNYRIFISYARSDEDKAAIIFEDLKKKGFLPEWDKNLRLGEDFEKQIMSLISHSHVVLPIITRNSSKSQWTNHEVAFAKALNIPVMPVCLDDTPRGIISRNQALVLKDFESDKEFDRLSEGICNAVNRAMNQRCALYECGEHTESRATMFFEYSQQVHCICPNAGIVRQKGALSSFSIPDKRSDHELWKYRYGRLERPKNLYDELRKERHALYELAKNRGCKLILNYGLDYDSLFGIGAKRARIETLIEAIEGLIDNMPASNVVIALVERSELRSTTLVDDWYMAESITGSIRAGWLHTLFTRHAPTVRFWQEDFDVDLKEILNQKGICPEESARIAINFLHDMVRNLPKSS